MDKKLEISLCMINRNDSKNLDYLLDRVKDLFEEIIIVDTGSTDDSVSVARKYTDKVYEAGNKYLNEDGMLLSFSDPRNESFSYATQPWIMWLDTDDDIDDFSLFRKDFEELKLSGEKSVLRMDYLYSWNEDHTVCCQVGNRERIVKNNMGWKWETPVHEYLEHKDYDDFKEIFGKSKVIHRSVGARNANDRNFFILRNWFKQETDPKLIDRIKYYIADEMLHSEPGKYNFREYLDIFKQLAMSSKYKNEAAFNACAVLYNERLGHELISFLENFLENNKDLDCSQYREFLAVVYFYQNNDIKSSIENIMLSMTLPLHKTFKFSLFQNSSDKENWIKEIKGMKNETKNKKTS